MPRGGDGLHAPEEPAPTAAGGPPASVLGAVDGSQLETGPGPRGASLGELGGDVLAPIMDRVACGRCACPIHYFTTACTM